MSPQGGTRTLIILVLVALVAACGPMPASRPDPTRRPRPVASVAVIPQPTRGPSGIPIAESLAYSGARSTVHPPVELPGGLYDAEWSATAVGPSCVFRAEIASLVEDAVHSVPAGQAPNGATITGSSQLELPGGPYEVVVEAAACRWRLSLEPTSG
jgi:hypothetical protein